MLARLDCMELVLRPAMQGTGCAHDACALRCSCSTTSRCRQGSPLGFCFEGRCRSACFSKQRQLQLSSIQVAEYVRAPCAEPHDASVTADAVTQSRLVAACDSALDTRSDVHASGEPAGSCTCLCAWNVGNLTMSMSCFGTRMPSGS